MRKKGPSLGDTPSYVAIVRLMSATYPPGFVCIVYSNSWRAHLSLLLSSSKYSCAQYHFSISVSIVAIFTVLLYKYKCAILATPYHFGLCFLYIRPIPFTFRNSQLKWFTFPHTNGKSLFHWPKPASSVIAS